MSISERKKKFMFVACNNLFFVLFKKKKAKDSNRALDSDWIQFLFKQNFLSADELFPDSIQKKKHSFSGIGILDIFFLFIYLIEITICFLRQIKKKKKVLLLKRSTIIDAEYHKENVGLLWKFFNEGRVFLFCIGC